MRDQLSKQADTHTSIMPGVSVPDPVPEAPPAPPGAHPGSLAAFGDSLKSVWPWVAAMALAGGGVSGWLENRRRPAPGESVAERRKRILTNALGGAALAGGAGAVGIPGVMQLSRLGGERSQDHKPTWQDWHDWPEMTGNLLARGTKGTLNSLGIGPVLGGGYGGWKAFKAMGGHLDKKVRSGWADLRNTFLTPGPAKAKDTALHPNMVPDLDPLVGTLISKQTGKPLGRKPVEVLQKYLDAGAATRKGIPEQLAGNPLALKIYNALHAAGGEDPAVLQRIYEGTHASFLRDDRSAVRQALGEVARAIEGKKTPPPAFGEGMASLGGFGAKTVRGLKRTGAGVGGLFGGAGLGYGLEQLLRGAGGALGDTMVYDAGE